MDRGGAQPADTEMAGAAAAAGTAAQPHQPPQMAGMEIIPGKLSHGGRFIQYNIFGNIFVVTAKYKPPIMPIGKGAYGIACSASSSEANEHAAAKKIAKAFDNMIDAWRTLPEIKLLRHMDHENIVAIRDIFPPPQRESMKDVYISYELMDTDLHQIIRSNQALSEEHCQKAQLISKNPKRLIALIECYSENQTDRSSMCIAVFLVSDPSWVEIHTFCENVLHRDLKPSNLLLNANCELKICGFGLAHVTSESDFMTECVVTRCYRAPEFLLNSSDYTAAIDLWSVGCIFMELMGRKPLFPGRDHLHQQQLLLELIGTLSEAEPEFLNENARRYVRQLPVHPCQSLSENFPNVHPLAIGFVKKMLTFDTRRRITVDDALSHPYPNSLHDINDEPVCMTPFIFNFEQHARAHLAGSSCVQP